jgi:hypothetical protein
MMAKRTMAGSGEPSQLTTLAGQVVPAIWLAATASHARLTTSANRE